MNPFLSLRNYEEFVYTLLHRHVSIVSSTLVVAQRGAKLATVLGEIVLHDGYRLTIAELVTFDKGPLTLERYGYEVWRGNEKLYWYDSQPHPDNPALSSTHPHHKHVPPDIKHNRIPAPGLSLSKPNLPYLIEEIENDLIGHK